MLREEDGPFHIFSKGRDRLMGMKPDGEPKNPEGFWPQLISCFLCLSVWVATPFAIYLADGWNIAIYIFGLSGAAIILNEFFDN